MNFLPESVDPARRCRVGAWLWCLVAMVFGAVVLGGFTRLTGSGLSMVDWQPITGWLPPLNEGDWQRVFDLYRLSPQYRHVNYGMDVEGFKSIFWLEYVHRLWGRLMGVVFALPFVWFLARGYIERGTVWRIGLLFVLGGLQGVIGWLMVASGLVEHPEVSQYRLVLHLGAAMLIFAYMIWLALTLSSGRARVSQVREADRRLARGSVLFIAWLVVTMLAGGFVAGLDAGFTYNTFPLMDGRWIPDNAFAAWTAPFEDIATVQFNHRVAALGVVVFASFLWLAARGRMGAAALRPFAALAAVAWLQAALGIATLLYVVPTPLGAAHQAVAFVLLGCAVWTHHSLSGDA